MEVKRVKYFHPNYGWTGIGFPAVFFYELEELLGWRFNAPSETFEEGVMFAFLPSWWEVYGEEILSYLWYQDDKMFLETWEVHPPAILYQDEWQVVFSEGVLLSEKEVEN